VAFGHDRLYCQKFGLIIPAASKASIPSLYPCQEHSDQSINWFGDSILQTPCYTIFMVSVKSRFILILIGLVFFTTACIPSTSYDNPTSAPTRTPVVLPDTWTPAPSQTTPPDPPNPSKTLDSITPPISAEYLPFEEIAMINSQEGWAWGFIKEWGMRIWHTSNGGQTWIDVTPNPKAEKFVFALDALTAWATICQSTEDYCEESLARTTDGGQTWSVLSQARFYAYWDIEFTSQDRGLRTEYDVGAGSGFWSFYETSDGGSTWEWVEIHSDHLGDELSFGNKYQTCNMCADRLYLDQELLMNIDGNLDVQPGDTIPISISYDRGISWQALELDFPNQAYKPGTFHPNQPLVFDDRKIILPVNLATFRQENSDMVFYSSSNGQNWRVLSIVEKVGGIYSWNQFDHLSNQEIIFACGGELCVTRDGAQTWERISSNLSFAYSQSDLYVDQFDFVDIQNGWALVEPVYRSYTLWRTTDGGKSWIELEPTYIFQ